MEITLNLTYLTKKCINPDEYILLYLIYYKEFDTILTLFGAKYALELRKNLINSGYILDATGKFRETILSNKNVEKLLKIRSEKINFWEFYNCYPVKVGSRILRSAGPTSQVALKHEKKYLSRVKTQDEHLKAIASINAFVSKKRQTNTMQYLPQMETVLNNNLWEQWDIFIQDIGTEEQEWNTDSI